MVFPVPRSMMGPVSSARLVMPACQTLGPPASRGVRAALEALIVSLEEDRELATLIFLEAARRAK